MYDFEYTWNQTQNRRRHFIHQVLGMLGLLLLPHSAPQSRTLTEAQLDRHKRFAAEAANMRSRAIAQGDQAYGAIIVLNDEIVGWGPSRVIERQDPTAHAEMEAIRNAAHRLGRRSLKDCVLYSTSPPCRMCETAAYWAEISDMYHGGAPNHGGTPEYGC